MLVAFVAGCEFIDSEHPLSTVETAVAVPGVIGTWLASDGKDKLTIKIDSAGDQFPKNMLRLSVVIEADEEFLGFCYITKMNGEGKYENVHCVNVVVFKERFKDQSVFSLDIRPREPKKWNPDEVESYQLFACKLVDGAIEVFEPNKGFLLSAVKAGTIKDGGAIVDEAEAELIAEMSFTSGSKAEIEAGNLVLGEPTKGLNKFFQANLEKVFPKATIKMTRKK